MNKEETARASAELLRKKLGSITLDEIEKLEKEDPTDAERKERAGTVEVFYKHHFEKVLKLLIQKQLEFIGQKSTDEMQWLFGRGTISGFILVRDWFEARVRESTARHQEAKEKEEVEPHEIP